MLLHVRMSLRTVASSAVTVFALAGCTKDVAQSGDAPPADANVADAPPGYGPLISARWDLPAGANVYKCVRVTVTADTYITSVQTQADSGSHHAVLALADERTGGPDGVRDCDAGTIGTIMIYAASVGTSPFELPEGIGIKVAAGRQLHMNLHLLNSGDEPRSGSTSILVKSRPTPPPTLAEMVLAGPVEIAVPSDNLPHSVTGECTATTPYTLFALWPHMHTFATHQMVELVGSGAPSVLLDNAFRFEEQAYYTLAPMRNVVAGERIRVTCTYVNNTGSVVTYGDGATSEMCFSGLYRFPAAGSYEYCAH